MIARAGRPIAELRPVKRVEIVFGGWSRLLRNLQARELPLTVPHMIRAGAMDWDHRDPFDRMLVAQAQLEGLILITADRSIRAHEEVRTLWPDGTQSTP